MKRLSSPVKLIKDSFKIFFDKANLSFFLKIYLILVPFDIFFYFQSNFVTSVSKNLNASNATSLFSKYPALWATGGIINILFIVISILVSIAGIVAVANVVDKKELNVKSVFSQSLKMLWPFIGFSIVLFLIALGGLLLLIIPALIFGIWFMFSKFVFINEGLGVKASLSKSKNLVKGYFWQITGRIIVIGIFVALIEAVITSIPYQIGQALISLSGALFILPVYLLYRELEDLKRVEG